MLKKLTFIISFSIAAFIIFLNASYAFAKNINSEKQIETLNKINKYQENYFTIVKRNNVFLNTENNTKLSKDRKELKRLYKEVKKQITNKQYLKEYKNIEKRYLKCKEETTIGINEFAQNNYNDVDALLNKTYKAVKAKVSSEEFKNIAASEKRWLKEVGDYDKIYYSMEYGTIGTSIYLDYQTDMRNFRTLLLMLYL